MRNNRFEVQRLGFSLCVLGLLSLLCGWGAANPVTDRLDGFWAYYALTSAEREPYYALGALFLCMGFFCRFGSRT